eukprot:5451596-Amphidinium_carterae.1
MANFAQFNVERSEVFHDKTSLCISAVAVWACAPHGKGDSYMQHDSQLIGSSAPTSNSRVNLLLHR